MNSAIAKFRSATDQLTVAGNELAKIVEIQEANVDNLEVIALLKLFFRSPT